MKRIFIAIDLSEEARNSVSSYINSLKDAFQRVRVGWAKAEKLHLTLRFLGDINDAQLELVIKGVRQTAVHFSPFRLRIEDAGVFPSARKARVLWLGLTEERHYLQEIVNVLETELEKIGFVMEKRSFHPHLTIARLREPRISADLVKLHQETHFGPVEFDVSEIVVYESKLLPNSSVYEIIAKIKLAGSEPLNRQRDISRSPA